MTTPARTAALEQIDRLLAGTRFLVQCLKATGAPPAPAVLAAALRPETGRAVRP